MPRQQELPEWGSMSSSAEAVVLSTRLATGGVAPTAGLRRLMTSGFSRALSSGSSRDSLFEALRGVGSAAGGLAVGTGLSSSSRSVFSSSEAAVATDGMSATSLPSKAGSNFFFAARLGAAVPAPAAGSDQ